MPICTFPKPKSGQNSGSCSAALSYLEKEDKDRKADDVSTGFFTNENSGISTDQAKDTIEHKAYKGRLGKEDSKFYTVVMAFSKEELKGKDDKELDDKELIDFAQKNFAEMYCSGVKGRESDPSSIAWVGKLEQTRKHKGFDDKVQAGEVKSGQIKEGDNRHIHFVVARKTTNDKKISPQSNHFREGKSKGNARGGYDQVQFKLECETRFDQRFSHSRKNEDRVAEKLAPYRPDLFSHTKIAENNLTYLKKKTKAILEGFKSLLKLKEKAKTIIQAQEKHSKRDPNFASRAKDLTQSFKPNTPEEKKPEKGKDQDRDRGRPM